MLWEIRDTRQSCANYPGLSFRIRASLMGRDRLDCLLCAGEEGQNGAVDWKHPGCVQLLSRNTGLVSAPASTLHYSAQSSRP
jgi:hypothetical protein